MRTFVFFSMLILLGACAPFVSAGETFSTAWSAELSGSAPTGPVVGDLDGKPGLDVFTADDAGMVRCTGKAGALVWEYNTGLTEANVRPALGKGGEEPAPLAAAVADGVACLDAASGAERWRLPLGAVGAGGLVWANLDGTGVPALLVALEGVIAALDNGGNELWRFQGAGLSAPLKLTRALAAADSDGDDNAEIFGCSGGDVFSLDAQGQLRWSVAADAEPVCAPVVADTDEDGVFEVFAVLADGSAAAFDADKGGVLWTCAEALPAVEAAWLALGDFNGDRKPEVVAAGGGNVALLLADGTRLWSVPAGKEPVTGICVADLDGDTGLEIVTACGDGSLVIVKESGTAEPPVPANVPIAGPPAVGDFDGDGTLDILAGGKSFSCITTGTPLLASALAWPQARFDAGNTGAWTRLESAEGDGLSIENSPLIGNSGFDEGDPSGAPLAWKTDGAGTCTLNTEGKIGGTACLSVTPQNGELRLVSEPAAFTPELRSVTGMFMGKGAGAAKVTLEWLNDQGDVVQTNVLRALPPGAEGWRRFALSETYRPVTASHARILLAATGTEPVLWDQGTFTGTFRRMRRIEIYVNQAGYDVGMPKRFVVASNFQGETISFDLLDKDNTSVFSGTVPKGDRIAEGGNADWGWFYARTNFDDFNTPGVYSIRVTSGKRSLSSPPFEVAYDFYWSKVLPLLMGAFKAQRCGTEAPGYHAPCHLDDAVPGGWHNGTEYSKTNDVECLWALTDALGVAQWKLNEFFGDGKSPLHEEAAWGADMLMRMVAADGTVSALPVSNPDYWGAPEKETDNQPGTGDERKLAPEAPDTALTAMTLARAACYLPGNAGLVDAADRALRSCLDAGRTEPRVFGAAMSLFLATLNEGYGETAKKLYAGPDFECAESIIDLESEFEVMTSPEEAIFLRDNADKIVKSVTNPFGLYPSGNEGKSLLPEDGTGNTARILEAACIVAKAFRFNPIPEVSGFVYDQFNWLMGVNPFGVCLIEGLGSDPPPAYCHRYAAGGVARGAVPGAIANGIKAGSDGKPAFDFAKENPAEATNGVDMRNNARFVNALAHLKRLRISNISGLGR